MRAFRGLSNRQRPSSVAVVAAARRVDHGELHPDPDQATLAQSSSTHSRLIEHYLVNIDEVLLVNPDSPLAALRSKLRTPDLAESACFPGLTDLVQLAMLVPDDGRVIDAALQACDMSLAAATVLSGAAAAATMTLCAAHCIAIDHLVPRLPKFIPDDQQRAAAAQALTRSRAAALAMCMKLVEEGVEYLRKNGELVKACKTLTLLFSLANRAADAKGATGVAARQQVNWAPEDAALACPKYLGKQYEKILVEEHGALKLLPRMTQLLSEAVMRPVDSLFTSYAVKHSNDLSVPVLVRISNLDRIFNQFCELSLLVDATNSKTWRNIGGKGCVAGFLKPCALSFFGLHEWLAPGTACAAAQLLPKADTADVRAAHLSAATARIDARTARMEARMQELYRDFAALSERLDAYVARYPAPAHIEQPLRAMDLNRGANPGCRSGRGPTSSRGKH